MDCLTSGTMETTAPFALVTIGELPAEFHEAVPVEGLYSAADTIGMHRDKIKEELVFAVPDTYLSRQYALWANSAIDAMPPPLTRMDTYLKVALEPLVDYVQVHGRDGLLFHHLSMKDFGHPHQAIRRLVDSTKPFQTTCDNMAVYVRKAA